MSKGSWHRAHSHKRYAESWDRIFGKKRKKKYYDLSLDIVQSLAGDGALGYYSKGHHDPVVFAVACEAEFGESEAGEIDPDVVLHEYWRCVQPSPDNDFCDDPYMRKFIKSKPGPGAFPVTHIELEPWSRQ